MRPGPRGAAAAAGGSARSFPAKVERRLRVTPASDDARSPPAEAAEPSAPGEHVYSKSCARSSNRVYWERKASLTSPMGPLRCLPTMISAIPFLSSGVPAFVYISSR